MAGHALQAVSKCRAFVPARRSENIWNAQTTSILKRICMPRCLYSSVPQSSAMMMSYVRRGRAIVWSMATLTFLATLHTVFVVFFVATGSQNASAEGPGLRIKVRIADEPTSVVSVAPDLSGLRLNRLWPRKNGPFPRALHSNGVAEVASGTSALLRPKQGHTQIGGRFIRRADDRPGGVESVSERERAELVLARLRAFKGPIRARCRGVQALVSAVGVVGMFAAIAGAMLGLWLDEAIESEDEGECFSYWDDTDDSPLESIFREEHYGIIRGGECFYGD
jgi:hypothetical protein